MRLVGRPHHEAVNLSTLQFGRREFHTNTIEGYFSIFMLGMRGIYQRCAKSTFSVISPGRFRYTDRATNGVNDSDRAVEQLKRVVGRRLTDRAAYACAMPSAEEEDGITAAEQSAAVPSGCRANDRRWRTMPIDATTGIKRAFAAGVNTPKMLPRDTLD